MISIDSIPAYLHELYAFSHIPTYLLQGNALLSCEPQNAGKYFLSEQYIQDFLSSKASVSYVMTDFHCFYGCVHIHDSEHIIISGPISTIPYSKHVLQELRKTFLVPEEDYENFQAYFHSVPSTNLNDLSSYLSLLNFSINETDMSPINLNDASLLNPDKNIHEHYANAQYDGKEIERFNNSLEVEKRFTSCIENGDVSGMQTFFKESYTLNTGIVADNNLRQIKNEFIITTTLCCRAAIRGGLSSDIAFHLSDAYIQQIEAANHPTRLFEISGKMMLDYTERVAANIVPLTEDITIQRAIQYVQQNTNRHITVEDIAHHVGFSRSYLSHKFKETLGFELNAFIRRCKLEEAKELLRYTDKPIGDISNYLCFSSQSYFQNCFKKQYGVTPQKYRNSPSENSM